ncbi:MAG: hypothetical protein V1645_05225 [archaeon]
MRWLLFVLFLLSSIVLAQELCPGCPYDSKCVDYGSQISTPQGAMYCSDDSNLYPAKPDSASCSQSYECASFMCSAGSCQTLNPETIFFDSHSKWFVPFIVIGSLFLLAIIFLVVKSSIKPKVAAKADAKSSKPGSKSQGPSLPSSVRLMPMNKKYSQFDKLERQIEATTKKISKK